VDPVIEIAITPNRPDALGVRGVARDLAARGLGTMKARAVTPVPAAFTSDLTVSIAEDTLDGWGLIRAAPKRRSMSLSRAPIGTQSKSPMRAARSKSTLMRGIGLSVAWTLLSHPKGWSMLCG